MNLGIDLGTSRVVICSPGDHAENGIVLDEPAVIAVDQRDGHLVACGEEAEKMLGRTPASIRAVRPLQNGVIAEYELAEMMLRHFLHRVCSNRVTKPCVAVSIAEKVTEVEQRSFIEAVVSAGARRVTLVPETVAAAIGAGLDVSRPRGQMLVNVGGGTTDAAVLSLRGTAVSASLRVAGTAMDEAIVRYVRAQYGLLIGEPMAERVKIAIGGVQRRDPAGQHDREGARRAEWAAACGGDPFRRDLRCAAGNNPPDPGTDPAGIGDDSAGTGRRYHTGLYLADRRISSAVRPAGTHRAGDRCALPDPGASGALCGDRCRQGAAVRLLFFRGV